LTSADAASAVSKCKIMPITTHTGLLKSIIARRGMGGAADIAI
jgi:hypothetical protein